MQENGGTHCTGFAGESASSAAYYTLMAGADGKTYRYDLYGDFVSERPDASATAKVDRAGRILYRTSATGKPKIENVLYNEHTLIQPENAKVTKLDFGGYKVVNFSAKANKNMVYVLLQKEGAENTYCIKVHYGIIKGSQTCPCGFHRGWRCQDGPQFDNGHFLQCADFIYYSYDNAIYRWTPTTLPPTAPEDYSPGRRADHVHVHELHGQFPGGSRHFRNFALRGDLESGQSRREQGQCLHLPVLGRQPGKEIRRHLRQASENHVQIQDFVAERTDNH